MSNNNLSDLVYIFNENPDFASKLKFEISGTDLKQLIDNFVELKISSKSASSPPENDLISQDEACEFLKVSRQTLLKWRKDGKISSRYLGRRNFYSRNELIAAMNKVNLKKAG